MRLAYAVLPIALLTFGALAACGNAPGTVQGGEALFPPPIDCTPSASLCGTWTHMYGCYFGPQAANGGCAGSSGECHATSAGTGAGKSGFVCGATQASCWGGMTTSTSSTDAPLADPSMKSATPLILALYKKGTTPPATDTDDNMPTSSFGGPPVMNANWAGFEPADVQCVEDWVAAGAPNN
jgi:hypothetical protein